MFDSDWRYAPGGLMRCCIETLRDHNAPGLADGHALNCKHCPSVMLWGSANQAWYWGWRDHREVSDVREPDCAA